MNLKFRVVSSQRGILAAKKALIVPFVASVMALPVKAGIPVIDGTNVVQTTISAVNNVLNKSSSTRRSCSSMKTCCRTP